MAEKDTELEKSVKEIPGLVQKLKEFFSKEKFAEIKVGDKTYSYSGAEIFGTGVDIKDILDGDYETDTHKFTVKSGKVIDYKPKETPATPDPSVEMKAEFTKKFTEQKEAFEKLISGLTEAFNKKIEALEQNATKKDEILKNMFDLIQKISESPSMESAFKKKDGEPATPQAEDKWARIEREAKALSQKVFKN